MSKITKKQLEQLLQPKKNSVLTATEKAKMRMNLSSFVDENPVKSSWSAFLLKRVFHLRPILASLMVVVLFSGVSLASASDALPGDFFYPVKILVNEDLPKLFMDSEEKQDFVLVQVENRLEEAQKLRESGVLTDGKRAVLKEQMDEYLSEHPLEKMKEGNQQKFKNLLHGHPLVLPDFGFPPLGLSEEIENEVSDEDEQDEDELEKSLLTPEELLEAQKELLNGEPEEDLLELDPWHVYLIDEFEDDAEEESDAE